MRGSEAHPHRFNQINPEFYRTFYMTNDLVSSIKNNMKKRKKGLRDLKRLKKQTS